MADITPRKIRFEYEDTIDFAFGDDMFGTQMQLLGLSLTMPYLEPYLIRTMKAALKEITDPQLAEDVRHFSMQEGHHYRNHATFNDVVRKQFDDETADKIRAIEAALEADYQRFTKTKSLKFNAAYAEGFEAMTCAGALSMAEQDGFAMAETLLPGGELWAWHMAEEIEHRTVAFDVFEHLVGSYPYRIVFGTYAQFHYLSYIRKFANCMSTALGRKLPVPRTASNRGAVRRYFRTWSPRYTPHDIVVPEGVEQLLARYSEMEKAANA
jgi:predicted metal-dependent hydrolase